MAYLKTPVIEQQATVQVFSNLSQLINS